MTMLTTHGLAPVREILRNRAVVTVKQSRTTPAVTISAAVQAGSVCEPLDKTGLAYFLSRVIDRGTQGRSTDAIAEDLDTRGVSLNVTVRRHVMTLICSCLADDFEAILDLMADVIRTATCPDQEIAKRRAEIVTAIRQDEDNPAIRAVEGLMNLLYGSAHPYGRPAKGSADSVARIDRDALVDFHRAQFAPAVLSLVIVGDVQPSRAVAAASRAFADWQGRAAASSSLPAVAPPTERRRLVLPMMNKAQTDIAYGFTTIARTDPAYYAFSILNNILGRYGMGGRLGHSIRERQGMAYYAFSTFDASVAVGPLVVRAGVNPANVDRAVASIDEEITRIAADGVSPRELAESKGSLIGAMPRMLETNAAIATFLQTAQFFDLGLDYDLRVPDLLGAVTREQVGEAARRTLSPDRASIVIAGPYAEAGRSDPPIQ